MDSIDIVEKTYYYLMAMAAKTFTIFRAHNNRFIIDNFTGSSISRTFDKSQVICFKCGKKVYFKKECFSKCFSYTPLADESFKTKV